MKDNNIELQVERRNGHAGAAMTPREGIKTGTAAKMAQVVQAHPNLGARPGGQGNRDIEKDPKSPALALAHDDEHHQHPGKLNPAGGI